MSYQFKSKPKPKADLPLSPRLKKVQAYCDTHDCEFLKRGEDYQEIEFYDIINRNGNKDLMKLITGLYRLKLPSKNLSDTGDFDEALIYYMQQETIRNDGSTIQDARMHGVYQVPITNQNTNIRPNANPNQKVQVRGTRPVYDIAFTPENVDKIIKESSIGVNMFYLAMGTSTGPEVTSPNPDTIKNIDDFKNGEFYELIDMSKYNFTTSESKLDQWRKESKQIKSNAHLLNTINAANTMNQRRG